MKMKTNAVLIVMVVLIGFCFFAPVVSAETAEEWNEEGISFGKAGNYEKAIEDYNKAIELDPNYAVAYNNREVARSKLEEQKTSQLPIPTPEEKSVPGFEAVSAIAGLLAVTYLLRKRK